ncbi:MAG: ABC transporter permease [Lachnospiraceae bacterium]|nr:ABC transporter permease [Lachnospiraceae bacterium]
MLNMIKSELYKIKKNKIFYVCSCIVILPALWVIYKDKILTTPPDDISNWIQSANVITSLFLSIASGFVITFLIQREYEDKTIINVLSAPTSRSVFIFSKFTMWLLWYLLLLGISMAIYMIGGKLIYADRFGRYEIGLLFQMIAKGRVLSFVASAPLLLIAILQRKTFYPSIMCSLVFTGMELFALMLPIRFGSMLPWPAAMLLGYGITGWYRIQAVIAVIISGIAGIAGACVVFQRQNQ